MKTSNTRLYIQAFIRLLVNCFFCSLFAFRGFHLNNIRPHGNVGKKLAYVLFWISKFTYLPSFTQYSLGIFAWKININIFNKHLSILPNFRIYNISGINHIILLIWLLRLSYLKWMFVNIQQQIEAVVK